MSAKARVTTIRGANTLRLPKEGHFLGTAVPLRRSKDGVGRRRPQGDVESRRRRFLKLAGSCPDFPETSGPAAADVPRFFAE